MPAGDMMARRIKMGIVSQTPVIRFTKSIRADSFTFCIRVYLVTRLVREVVVYTILLRYICLSNYHLIGF